MMLGCFLNDFRMVFGGCWDDFGILFGMILGGLSLSLSYRGDKTSTPQSIELIESIEF